MNIETAPVIVAGQHFSIYPLNLCMHRLLYERRTISDGLLQLVKWLNLSVNAFN